MPRANFGSRYKERTAQERVEKADESRNGLRDGSQLSD